MPAFSSVATTLAMRAVASAFDRAVASAFARARLWSCMSTPMATRATSGATEMRPSPEAWTVRGAFGAAGGGAWARSRAAARAGIIDPPVLRVAGWFQRAGARNDPYHLGDSHR